MRTFYTVLFIAIAFGQQLMAQSGGAQPDTLLNEQVIGNPISTMLTVPTGYDNEWVNYDQDVAKGYCVDENGGPTPFGWYIERDFGFPDGVPTTNNAFTSCSYLYNHIRNNNWLILPPVFILDGQYQLCWRSLALEGPAFVDGYNVVVSTSSNLPSSGGFSDTLFTAAETIKLINTNNVGSYDIADYLFSPGYIHANGYTDTNYYFLPSSEDPYRGRLEPHCVSLAAYQGQSIYIAFHHNSKDDNLLQLDDILITNTTATQQPDNFLTFDIMPNPAVSSTFVKWTLKKPEAGRLQLRDQSGKLLLEKRFSAYEAGQLFLELDNLPAGMHHCTLQTASGLATRKLVKL